MTVTTWMTTGGSAKVWPHAHDVSKCFWVDGSSTLLAA
jgi:hypothetical protein